MRVKATLAGLGTCALAMTALTAAPAQASITTVTVTVNAKHAPPGVQTLDVTVGDTVTINASGNAQYGYQGAAPCGPGYPITTPDGSEYFSLALEEKGVSCGMVYSSDATLPKAPIGDLLRRISNGGGWVAAGESDTFTAERTGTLYLVYNDSIYSDNSGSYTVTVTDNSG